jgi:hypothetical protein
MNQSLKIAKELEKIKSSKEFKDSKSYKTLLEYLVDCSKKGITPTESSIAAEGLNKKINFDSASDASVRVYIHNLRKKLDSYYLHEGKNDLIRISIPKGQHYAVEFNSNEETSNFFKKHKIISTAIIFLILSNLFSILFILYSKKDSTITGEINPWSDISNSEFPVLLVFGDYFVLKDSTSERNNYVRDILINSYNDYQRLSKEGEIEENKYVQTEITYLGKFTLWCFNELYPMINAWDKPIELKLSSQLVWEDLGKYDIVFIGPFKTLSILNNFVSGLNSSYQITPNRIIYNDAERDTVYEYHSPKNFKTGYVKDYTLVAKLPGLNENNVMIFSSTHDIGHISTIKYFTDEEFLMKFQNQFDSSNKKKYFEAIFEVEGFERTGFFPELFHFRNIEDTYSIGVDREPFAE